MDSFRTPAVLTLLAIVIAGSARGAQPPTPAEVGRSILYPAGLQARRSLLTGKLEMPSFHFVAAAKLPQADRSVVLYAEEIGSPSTDHEHFVFVATIDDRAKQVLDRVSLNDLLPLSLDVPAQFKELGGSVTPLDVPARTLVDVTTSTLLSGTGGITAISDFIFIAGSDGRLTLALRLPFTGGSGRSGWRWAQSSSSDLFLAPSGDAIAVESWKITKTLAQPEGPATEQCEAKGPMLYGLKGKTFVAQETAKSIHTEAMKPIPRPSFATVRRCVPASH